MSAKSKAILASWCLITLAVADPPRRDVSRDSTGGGRKPIDEAVPAAGTGGDPCENATFLFDGSNELDGLPVDYLDGRYLEMICLGFICDPGCLPPFPFRWAQYTATCTEIVSLTTYTTDGEIAAASLVVPGCDCSLRFGSGVCPFDRVPVDFPAVEGKCYRLAIFSGHALTIEPLDDLTNVCEYNLPGYYVGDRYDNVMAFVSCQNDCNSPTCEKCFDLDANGQIDLRDFAEFQNNFWLF